MGEYFDTAYAVKDGMILFYEDDDVTLLVPQKMGDMDIHTIGNGAFMESLDLQYVSLPLGVKSIGKEAFKGCKNLKCLNIPISIESFGDNAFANCPNLRDIRIYGYGVSEQKYLEMKATWQCAKGSIYIASSFPDDKIMRAAVKAAGIGPASLIPEGILRLFETDIPIDKGMMSMYTKQKCLGFGNRSSFLSETESIKELVESPVSIEVDEMSESKNDQFLKSESFQFVKKTAILTFDDNKTKLENGTYNVLFDIIISYHFWQSVVPINYDGKTYYIYRRHFLNADNNLNYIRYDVQVVSDKGEKARGEGAQMVGAKYRLLSIL